MEILGYYLVFIASCDILYAKINKEKPMSDIQTVTRNEYYHHVKSQDHTLREEIRADIVWENVPYLGAKLEFSVAFGDQSSKSLRDKATIISAFFPEMTKVQFDKIAEKANARFSDAAKTAMLFAAQQVITNHKPTLLFIDRTLASSEISPAFIKNGAGHWSLFNQSLYDGIEPNEKEQDAITNADGKSILVKDILYVMSEFEIKDMAIDPDEDRFTYLKEITGDTCFSDGMRSF
jgi:hypothetical protein